MLASPKDTTSIARDFSGPFSAAGRPASTYNGEPIKKAAAWRSGAAERQEASVVERPANTAPTLDSNLSSQVHTPNNINCSTTNNRARSGNEFDRATTRHRDRSLWRIVPTDSSRSSGLKANLRRDAPRRLQRLEIADSGNSSPARSCISVDPRRLWTDNRLGLDEDPISLREDRTDPRAPPPLAATDLF